jgi:hypothetical protein
MKLCELDLVETTSYAQHFVRVLAEAPTVLTFKTMPRSQPFSARSSISITSAHHRHQKAGVRSLAGVRAQLGTD